MFEGAVADSGKSGYRSTQHPCSRSTLAMLVVAVIHLWAAEATRAQDLNSDRGIQFDIPSQPLASALREYSKTAGLDVFYDGSLAVDRRSAAVRGTFTPLHGLQAVLAGTGYVPRGTEIANTVTIVSAPPVEPLRATFDRYQPYFAALQARLSEALCNDDGTVLHGKEIRLKFWLDPSGAVSNAELIDMDRNNSRWSGIAPKIRGLQIRMAPPAGLPQPVTMVIYPPSTEETACRPMHSRHARN